MMLRVVCSRFGHYRMYMSVANNETYGMYERGERERERERNAITLTHPW